MARAGRIHELGDRSFIVPQGLVKVARQFIAGVGHA